MAKSLRYILILPLLIVLVGTACNLSSGPTPPRPVPTLAPQDQTIDQMAQTLQPDPNTGKLKVHHYRKSTYYLYHRKPAK